MALAEKFLPPRMGKNRQHDGTFTIYDPDTGLGINITGWDLWLICKSDKNLTDALAEVILRSEMPVGGNEVQQLVIDVGTAGTGTWDFRNLETNKWAVGATVQYEFKRIIAAGQDKQIQKGTFVIVDPIGD